jgi:hypothetical protein
MSQIPSVIKIFILLQRQGALKENGRAHHGVIEMLAGTKCSTHASCLFMSDPSGGKKKRVKGIF